MLLLRGRLRKGTRPMQSVSFDPANGGTLREEGPEMKSPIRVQRRRGRDFWWLGRKANVTGPNMEPKIVAYSSP